MSASTPTPGASTAPLLVKWTETEAEFASLQSEWNALVLTSELDSVFLRHEWFDAAWQWLRSSVSFRILRFYEGSKLIGLCPLMIGVQKIRGVFVRELKWIQVPDSQLCDLISTTQNRGRVCAEMLRQLQTIQSQWDTLSLDRIPSASSTLTHFPRALRDASWFHRKIPENPNPYINLKGTWDEYYARRSRRLRKGNNLIRNHLARDYKSIVMERIPKEPGVQDRVEFGLTEAIRLSGLSWKQETGVSLDQPAPNAFIRRLTEHASAQGWLSIWVLSLDEKPVAMEYQIIYASQVYALRSDFDAAYNDHSPGTYMNMDVLKALIESPDEQRYLMGPGDNAYKLRWSEEFEMLGGFLAYSPSLRGRLFGFLALKIKEPLQRLREQWKVKAVQTDV